MKRILISFLMLITALLVNAQSRRPIDPQHPLWLVHIDAWNYPDPQQIIDLIPEDIKPYVCLNLSLSCAFNTSTGYHQKPENAVLTFKSWASVCCQNNVWFTCQHASGGHCHIKDNDLDTFEYFFTHYKNFLGWNYAEQFWGFDEAGDEYSSSQESRIALFAKLVPMSHKYGGVLIVSYCGNIYSHALNPVGMMKRNAELMQACKSYPEAILWCYKYTSSACWYNNESVCLGPFVAGLAKNYGLRYDNCGWDGGTEAYEKAKYNTSRSNRKYPESVGIGPVLDQIVNNGACVFDGPELIWTQCFRENNATTVDGYRHRSWTTYTQFDNIWVDMFRKIIDGTIHIATRDEVVDRTKIVVVQNFPIAQDDGYWQKWKAYATKDDMYNGLYKQNDPMNYDSGNKDQNWLFFKKTGRYQAIPVVNELYDAKAQSIPVKVYQTDIVSGSVWGNEAAKVAQFNAQYPEEYTGDLFASRHKNEWVVYYPFSYYYSYEKTASASMALKYNTCSRMDITMQKFDAGVVKEFSDHLDIYLNNFRTDTTTVKTATIKISGATAKPAYTYKNRSVNNTISGGLNISENWSNNVYTLTVRHMGPVEIRLNCAGSASGKLSNYLSDNILKPQQPEASYNGPVITEAEVFDTKSVSQIVTDAYAQQNSIHNHSGLGFVMMGTNASAAIRTTAKIPATKSYYVRFRYSAPNGGMTNYRICVDNEANEVATVTFNNTGSYSTWQETSNTISLSAGTHKIYLKAVAAGNNLAIDQMTIVPTDYQETIITGDAAPFNYDKQTGRYIAALSYLTPGGNLSFDSATGLVTLPAGKTGTLTLTFNGADFSNVSQVKLSRTGDDLFNTLTINTTGGTSINNGSSFWSSKYDLNFANYQSESASIKNLVWTGTNTGSTDMTMTIGQLLVQVDVMRAGKKHEQELSRWAFALWNGAGQDAARVEGDTDMAYNVNEVLGAYGVVYGAAGVLDNQYADLSRYSKLRVYGDDGLEVRAIFNQQQTNSANFVEKAGAIADGVFEVDLAEVGGFAHLNALKIRTNNVRGSVWRIMVVDDDDPMDYHIYGKEYVDTNLTEALADKEATNYDATAITSTIPVALTTANKNALIYVDEASKVSNDHNVVVKDGNGYSASNIVLVDGLAAAQSDRPGAYFPGGSVKAGNATWTDTGNGSYSFHWNAGTQAEVQIFNYILERQDYSHLVVETASFTKPWGIRFIDADGQTIAEQGYWAGQHDGNRVKDIDIDSLFAAQGVSAKRSVLTMVRLYNISDEEGEVVLRSAYLCNSQADCVYPFFAPYDITAATAKITTAVAAGDGSTTLCIPFAAAVPSGFKAYNITKEGASQVSALTANRPVILTGTGTADFSASNVVVKATDNLINGLMAGVYRTTSVPAGCYAQSSADASQKAFSPVQGVTLYEVGDGQSFILSPFRAYATGEVEPDEPRQPYELTVSEAGVATVYLDFDAIIPDEDFFIVTAVKEVDGTAAYLKEVRGGVIPANTGVMIFANPGKYMLYPSDTPATEEVHSLLHGVLEDTPINTVREREDGAEIYVLSRGIKEYTGFKIVGKTVKAITANKAYLPVAQSGEAKTIYALFGGHVVTGIDDLKAGGAQTGGDIIYDLSGRRVIKPQSGIYIINGKKILLKK